MSFTESNTVEQMILAAAISPGSGAGSSVLREDPASGCCRIAWQRMKNERRWP
jgi:hypothetical protein